MSERIQGSTNRCQLDPELVLLNSWLLREMGVQPRATQLDPLAAQPLAETISAPTSDASSAAPDATIRQEHLFLEDGESVSAERAAAAQQSPATSQNDGRLLTLALARSNATGRARAHQAQGDGTARNASGPHPGLWSGGRGNPHREGDEPSQRRLAITHAKGGASRPEGMDEAEAERRKVVIEQMYLIADALRQELARVEQYGRFTFPFSAHVGNVGGAEAGNWAAHFTTRMRAEYPKQWYAYGMDHELRRHIAEWGIAATIVREDLDQIDEFLMRGAFAIVFFEAELSD